jgi:hypothetical protein
MWRENKYENQNVPAIYIKFYRNTIWDTKKAIIPPPLFFQQIHICGGKKNNISN